MLKQELNHMKQQMTNIHQSAIDKRSAYMNNPYHGGFEGTDSRDPYGGALK